MNATQTNRIDGERWQRGHENDDDRPDRAGQAANTGKEAMKARQTLRAGQAASAGEEAMNTAQAKRADDERWQRGHESNADRQGRQRVPD